MLILLVQAVFFAELLVGQQQPRYITDPPVLITTGPVIGILFDLLIKSHGVPIVKKLLIVDICIA